MKRIKELENIFKIAFADDFSIILELIEINDTEYLAEVVCNAVTSWGIRNHLKFNTAKTQAMLVFKHHNNQQISFRLNGQIIRTKDCLKYLGIIIDNKLNFNAHITKKINMYKDWID